MLSSVPPPLLLQYKTSEIASRCTSLVRVNIYKDSVVNAERLPSLPGAAALHSMLEPAYAALRYAFLATNLMVPCCALSEGSRHMFWATLVDSSFVIWQIVVLRSMLEPAYALHCNFGKSKKNENVLQ